MAKRINVKLIMDLSAGGLTQDEIATSRHFSKSSVSLVLKMVILANLGQGSYNSRTTSANYPDSVPESCGQRSYVIRTRTLSQKDKLTSLIVKYHKTASPSSAGGWCSTEGRREGPFKSIRYAFLTNRSRIASDTV